MRKFDADPRRRSLASVAAALMLAYSEKRIILSDIR
jgi:hypothetical protein